MQTENLSKILKSKKQNLGVHDLFDESLIKLKKLRARRLTSPKEYALMKIAAQELEERLKMIKRSFSNAVALFNYTPHVATILKQCDAIEKVQRIETDKEFLERQEGSVFQKTEFSKVLKGADLLVSLFFLHDVNDLTEFFHNIRNTLADDGLFLGAMAGYGTLAELRESLLLAETEMFSGVTPRIMPFIHASDASFLLQKTGFIMPVADIETTILHYPDLFSLIRDLRAMGATNSLICRKRKPETFEFFERTNKIYKERFPHPKGGIKATFSTIWLSGWAPCS